MKKTKGEIKRQQILALARQKLIDDGHDVLSMRDLAVAADMRLGNLQYYFKTKEALVTEIFREEAETDIAALDQILSEAMQKSGDPITHLSALLLYVLEKWSGDAGRIFSSMAYLKQYNAAYEPIYDEVYEAFYLAQIKPLMLIQPGLTKSAYKAKARLICALIDGSTGMVLGRNKKQHFASVLVLVKQIATD